MARAAGPDRGSFTEQGRATESSPGRPASSGGGLLPHGQLLGAGPPVRAFLHRTSSKSQSQWRAPAHRQLQGPGQGSQGLPQAALLPLVAGSFHSQLLGADNPVRSFLYRASSKSQSQWKALTCRQSMGPGQGSQGLPQAALLPVAAGSFHSQLLRADRPVRAFLHRATSKPWNQ